jgi:hypothetical protein
VKKLLLVMTIGLAIAACGGRQITRVLPLSNSADAPYDRVLVVSLFNSFDRRRIFERAIVSQLTERGAKAVASTSRMTTRTPLNRETFEAMVEDLGADAVLVTQVIDVDTQGKVKGTRPEATYNVRATRYYNVWDVDYTEYREPPNIEMKNTLSLLTQVYSARTKQPVWAIETRTTVTKNLDDPLGQSVIIDEAKAMTRYLDKDGLLVTRP